MSMALELVLVHNNGKGFQADDLYVEDRLSFDQDYKLFGQINNERMGERGVEQICEPHPVPPGFKVMILEDEAGWQEAKVDPYGNRLTYVTAGELARIKPVDAPTDWNKAILAMMKALPADFPVILFWK